MSELQLQQGSPSGAQAAILWEQRHLRAKYGRFRMLIVGRANAGKTTILQKICNSTVEPQVFDESGNKVCVFLDILTSTLISHPTYGRLI